MKITTNCRKRRERGTQIVEFAVVLPLLAFLALVVSEGSGIIRAHQVINNAAREGARLSALPDYEDNTSAVQTAVAAYACTNGVQLAGSANNCGNPVNVTCNDSSSGVTVNQAVELTTTDASGNTLTMGSSQVTVTCSYKLTYFPPMSFPWMGIQVPNLVPLKTTATFQNLWGK